MVEVKSKATKQVKTLTDDQWNALERDGHGKNFQFVRKFTPTVPAELRPKEPLATGSTEKQKP